jgi:hypothetical protein
MVCDQFDERATALLQEDQLDAVVRLTRSIGAGVEMNIQSSCQDMCAKLGFGCVQLEDEYPLMMALQTPFGFYGGDPFEIYAEYLGDREQIRFFDSGGYAVPLLLPPD